MKKLIHALIPARGGSKGIKDKNIIDILDKPLISWTINFSKACKYIDNIYVSTDSKKIKEISVQCGADVPYLRPKEISGDKSLDIEFIKYHINWLKNNDMEIPYAIVHLRTTGPGRCISDINKAIQIIKNDSSLSGLRSVALSKLTPYKMWKIKDNIINPLIDDEVKELHSLPRQDLPRVFWQNGYIDIIKPETVMKENSMVGKNCFGLITSDEVIDLDYLTDIPEIEKMLKDINDGKINTLLEKDILKHSV
tara:strand:- start:512 stop:1267 length:756 start_codon:yes stop_codon:yes gene_type:complete